MWKEPPRRSTASTAEPFGLPMMVRWPSVELGVQPPWPGPGEAGTVEGVRRRALGRAGPKVDDGIGGHHRSKLAWQREHDVEVGRRKDGLTTLLQPPVLLEALAGWGSADFGTSCTSRPSNPQLSQVCRCPPSAAVRRRRVLWSRREAAWFKLSCLESTFRCSS
jgi:hypothetical protein